MVRNAGRRLVLFARDYFSEFGVAWSVARYRDCERNGGHRWDPPELDSLFGWSRSCRRCGCGESVFPTMGTAATNATTIRIAP